MSEVPNIERKYVHSSRFLDNSPDQLFPLEFSPFLHLCDCREVEEVPASVMNALLRPRN